MDYGSMSLPKLQAELRARGMRVSGRKKDLITQLRALDEMEDPGGSFPSVPPPSPSSPWPSPSSFRSVTLGDKEAMPHIRNENIESYVLYRYLSWIMHFYNPQIFMTALPYCT